MDVGSGVPVRTYHVAQVLDPKVAAKMGGFRDRLSAAATGYPVVSEKRRLWQN